MVVNARYFAQQEWKISKLCRCREAAAKIIGNSIKLVSVEGMSVENVVGEAMTWKRELSEKLNLLTDWPNLLFLNWSPPQYILVWLLVPQAPFGNVLGVMRDLQIQATQQQSWYPACWKPLKPPVYFAGSPNPSSPTAIVVSRLLETIQSKAM